jgi:hypothetical protein
LTDPLDAILALSPDVRYVALARDGRLAMRERAGLVAASAAESDRYEAAGQPHGATRWAAGQIDVGLDYVVIRYGNYYPVVRPIPGGHLAVAVEPHGDPLAIAKAVERMLPSLLAPGAV